VSLLRFLDLSIERIRESAGGHCYRPLHVAGFSQDGLIKEAQLFIIKRND